MYCSSLTRGALSKQWIAPVLSGSLPLQLFFLISKRFLGDYFFSSLPSAGYCFGVSVTEKLLIHLRRTTWHQGLIWQWVFNKQIQGDRIWTNTKREWQTVIPEGKERTGIWTKTSGTKMQPRALRFSLPCWCQNKLNLHLHLPKKQTNYMVY